MQELLLWTDLETTGLAPHTGEQILEVAAIVTDMELNELGQYTALVGHDDVDALRSKTNEYVQNMHDKTGLWDRLKTETVLPYSVLDEDFQDFINSYRNDETNIRIAGNSVKLDANFMEIYLPKSYSSLYYRVFDMSVLEFALMEWAGKSNFKKKLLHSALDDIRESLDQGRAYKAILSQLL